MSIPYHTYHHPEASNMDQNLDTCQIDPDLYSPSAALTPDVFTESVSHSAMSALLTPSQLPSQAMLPPLIYQKWGSFKKVPTPIANSPQISPFESADTCILAAN